MTELLTSHLGGVSNKTDYQIGTIRHGGWLLELERALLASGAERSIGAGQHQSADGNQVRESHVVAEPVGTPENAAAKASADSQRQPAEADELAPRFAHGHAYIAFQVLGGIQGIAASLSFAAQSSELAMQALSRPRGEGYQLRQPQAAIEPQTVTPPPSHFKPIGVMAMRILEQSHVEAESTAHREQPTADSDASDAAQDAESIARRQLHLYRDENGVHAWIRDAGLAEFQVYSIARALSGELNASGLKLTALTLNGKAVMAERGQAPPLQGEGIKTRDNSKRSFKWQFPPRQRQVPQPR